MGLPPEHTFLAADTDDDDDDDILDFDPKDFEHLPTEMASALGAQLEAELAAGTLLKHTPLSLTHRQALDRH